MRVFITKYDPKGIGGGFSFLRNFIKYAKSEISIASNIDNCDIVFVPGPTLATRDELKEAERKGKKIVFRVDNIPEDYRNRGTALSRLKDFSKMADIVIYQSEWSREYVKAFTGVDGAVIYNGIDRDIFNKNGRSEASKNILYVRSSTNENKRWQEAKYFFRQAWLADSDLHFYIAGNFADYIKLYGEDFADRYRLGLFDEPYTYIGNIDTPEKMASVYKDCTKVLTPFYNDACSNVILEARSCGCEVDLCLSGNSGGSPEIVKLPEEFIGAERMTKEYLGAFRLCLQDV